MVTKEVAPISVREDWKRRAKIFSTNIKNLVNLAKKKSPDFSLKKLCDSLKITTSIWSSWADRGSLPRDSRTRQRIAEVLSKAVGSKFTAHQLANEIINIGDLKKAKEEVITPPSTAKKEKRKTTQKVEILQTKNLIESISRICEGLVKIKEDLAKLPIKPQAPQLSKSEKEWLTVLKKLSTKKQKEVLNYAAFQASLEK